jgi:DNA-binding transcriptional LysR family regulator
MHALRQLIPSPSALITFEAAARLQSFTRAADELGVSQPAVSHSIRELERRLGVQLFERGARCVSLTPEGQWFFRNVAKSLAHIYQSALHLRRSHGLDTQVTISVSTAFAAHWLLPRIARFRSQHPEIDLRFQTSDRDVDLVAEGISIGIRLGDGEWAAYDAWRFAEEEVLAVCSPEYQRRRGPWRRPADLLEETLVHLEEPYRDCITWSDWFRRAGSEYEVPEHGLKLNDYALVLNAAVGGEGIALGWRHLVAHLLDGGELVKAVPDGFCSTRAFYVVTPKAWPINEATRVFRDWILRESAGPPAADSVSSSHSPKIDGKTLGPPRESAR